LIKSKQEKTGIEIDLTGPEGNAFYILGLAKKLCRDLGMTSKYQSELLDRMKSGDYENLIQEFDKSFGEVVTMYR
tara:strand:- start:1144 stop:1368 length:225 start_codon:yes stop_codon:yes gene_type:complete